MCSPPPMDQQAALDFVLRQALRDFSERWEETVLGSLRSTGKEQAGAQGRVSIGEWREAPRPCRDSVSLCRGCVEGRLRQGAQL